MQDLIGKQFRHYKNGKLYEIIGFATHTETLEEMVIYRSLYHSEQYGDRAMWVRPKQMFFESITLNGRVVTRFQKVLD